MVCQEDLALIVSPSCDLEEVSNKAGDVTLEQDIVAPDDMGLVDIGAVLLRDN